MERSARRMEMASSKERRSAVCILGVTLSFPAFLDEHERSVRLARVYLFAIRACCALWLLLFCASSWAGFEHRSDVSLRLDMRSDRPDRGQYRVRLEPDVTLGARWSLHAFLATGEAFPSAYNSFDQSQTHFSLRRLFARYASDAYRLELGSIPPFKGRVSATGLSKEGWIRGSRFVYSSADAQFEIVAGDLGRGRADRALTAPYDFNYFEVEYSARLNDTWSYELGAERGFDDTFTRSEVRLTPGDEYAWSVELLNNLTEGGISFTTGISRESAGGAGIVEEWLIFYSYTSPRFGARALLAEDFVGFGHSSGLYLSGTVSEEDRLSWFAEIEVGETRSRLKVGLSMAFGQ